MQVLQVFWRLQPAQPPVPGEQQVSGIGEPAQAADAIGDQVDLGVAADRADGRLPVRVGVEVGDPGVAADIRLARARHLPGLAGQRLVAAVDGMFVYLYDSMPNRSAIALIARASWALRFETTSNETVHLAANQPLSASSPGVPSVACRCRPAGSLAAISPIDLVRRCLPLTQAQDTIDQNDRCDRIEQKERAMSSPAQNQPLQDETYLPDEDAAEIIDFLSALRDRGREAAEPRARLTGPDGRSVELPAPMFEVLLQVAAAMKAGLAVTVAPHHLLLSTQEAADLLRISRTTLVRLLETGAIPFEKPSRHRKVRLDDLLEYRRRQRSAAELALADMIADTERLGLYDADPEDVKAALKAARRKTEG
jgi:excisionase family DNA binding protein